MQAQADITDTSRLTQMASYDKLDIAECEELSEAHIWNKHGPSIWKSERFKGYPFFYPIYRYNNYYSYSLLLLIRHKGELSYNKDVSNILQSHNFLYSPPNILVDSKITRIGGPLHFNKSISSESELISNLANAMISDMRLIESANPDFTNIVLCGGKDSLNMLFLPWSNKTIVASAPPNYDLVCDFIKSNHLSYDVIKLNNDEEPNLKNELLANCCRVNMEHYRWLTQLSTLSRDNNHKVVFWLGQLGDSYLTSKWKEYSAYGVDSVNTFMKLYQLIGSPFQWKLRHYFGVGEPNQMQFYKAGWNRGAMWQGVYNALLRELSGALAISCYHGPAVRDVRSKTDIARCVQRDVRPLLGKVLKGSTVYYPTSNPAPPVATYRSSLSSLNQLFEAMSEIGINIVK